MRELLDRVLAALLSLAAVAIAGVLLHREFFAAAKSVGASHQSEYISDWRSLLRVGRALGDTTGQVKLIELADFECPFCREFHRTLRSIGDSYPQEVVSVFVHRPLVGHRHARTAAHTSECGYRVGRFWQLADALFAKQDSFGIIPWSSYAASAGIGDSASFNKCLADSSSERMINAAVQVAERMDIWALAVRFATFGGRLAAGYRPASQWQATMEGIPCQ
jgi:hypothetical protein